VREPALADSQGCIVGAEMKNKIILFELNEVPFKVLDWYCQRNQRSNFAFLCQRSQQFKTRTEDKVMSPWVTWPSAHRGVFDSHHKISFLGQDLESADKKYPPVWQILSDNGFRTGVFGSLQSYPVPKDLSNYAFYVPDVFAPSNETFPESLNAFQQLNLVMSRESARNVSHGIPAKIALQLATQLPSLGISPATIADLVQQLVLERVDSSKLARRRTYQGVLAADIYLRLLNKTKPEFSTFFTNHVASNMHRFWAATFPEDFDPSEHKPEWSERYKAEIEFAMHKADAFLGQLLKFVNANRHYAIWVASSMGQGAEEKIPYVESMLLIADKNKFMKRLGLEKNDWEERPAMVPDYSFYVSPEKADRFRHLIQSLIIDGKTIPIYEESNNFFHISLGHTDLDGSEQLATLDGQKISFENLGLRCVESQDSVSASAYHVREGIFLIYESPAKQSIDRTVLPSTEIAPLILENFGIPVPGYMRQHSLVG